MSEGNRKVMKYANGERTIMHRFIFKYISSFLPVLLVTILTIYSLSDLKTHLAAEIL